MKTTLVIVFATTLLMGGCGAEADPNSTTSSSGTKTDTASTITDKATATASQLTENIVVVGYISPINITVDGVNYSDSENFYTKKLERLRSDAVTKYPQYSITITGDLGLPSFAYGFSAFIAAVGDTGYAGSTTVSGQGKLSFTFHPDSDQQVPYEVTVSKRLGIRLTKGSDVISQCYNLMGATQINLDGHPFLVRSFTSQVTSYQCGQDPSDSGIALPVPQSSLATTGGTSVAGGN